MEIKWNKNKTYAINPRRVIAIERDDAHNPRRVIIHMTDDFHIDFIDEDVSEYETEYERLRDELARIVGG